VTVSLTENVLVAVDQNKQVAVYGTVAPDATVSYFQLNVSTSGYIDAIDIDSGLGVPVNDEKGDGLDNLRSEPKRIFHPAAERAFLNFPNPFGEPGKEETTIIYYLEEDTDVEFYIYTLTGQLVWTRSFSQHDPQGAAGIHSTGPHAVTWNGTNDNGNRVLNGVYIVIMKSGTGQIEKGKIAHIK
jgi:hypothetical protein